MVLLAEPNAIGAALGLLGDEWSLLIVRDALGGIRRYGGWKKHLGISDSVLSARLSRLVDAGVLERVPYSTRPERFEYHLTESGLDLWQLLLSIWAWERQHAAGQSARLPQMVHRTCGRAFEPVVRCGRCHSPASVEDVRIDLGPSGTFERSIPVGTNRRRTTKPQGAVSHGPGLFPETMTLIGSRWSSALLGAAFLGATRFGDFERMLGAPPTIVAERLKAFVDLGVLDSVSGDGRQDRPAYQLSAKGRAFFPVVASFLAWGERRLPAPDGPAVIAVHRGCGKLFSPETACSECGEEINRRTLVVSPPDPF